LIIRIFNKKKKSEFLIIISLENNENNKIKLIKNKKDKLILKKIE
jgi:hypothetical protein